MTRELLDAFCNGKDTSAVSGAKDCYDSSRAAIAADEAMRLNKYVDVPE